MNNKDAVEIIDNLDPGELELRKIFEDVTTKNVRTIIEFTQDTRKLFRELSDVVDNLRKQLDVQNKTIAQLRLELTNVQTKLFSGGTS